MNTKGTNSSSFKTLIYIAAAVLLVATAFSIMHFYRPAAEPEYAPPTATAVPSAADAPATAWLGWQQGRIASADTALYQLADIGSQELCRLPQDTTVAAIEQRGDLLRVRTPAATGWIAAGAFSAAGEAAVLPEEPDKSGSEASPVLQPADRAALDKIAEYYECVGVSAALIKNGEVCDTYQYGWQDRAKEIQMTADTKLCTASLSKVLVGMSAASMRDMGILDLDKDISSYLGGQVTNYYYRNTPITLRHLLTHTSSIREVSKYTGPRAMMMDGKSWGSTCPGTKEAWRYSNIGIGCAGNVLEYASDMTLVDFTDSFYFDTMGVDASFYAPHINDRESISTLYRYGGGVVQSVAKQLVRTYTEEPGCNCTLYFGYLTISAPDYARLLCILMGDGSYRGTSYMSPESATELKTAQLGLKDFDQCIVLRQRANCYDGRTLHYHTGNSYGVLALASFDDSTGDGVVILTTGANGKRDQYDIYAVCGEMTEYCYGLL